MHKASNQTAFFYLVWSSLVIFYSAIAFMGMATAVLCPAGDGVGDKEDCAVAAGVVE